MIKAVIFDFDGTLANRQNYAAREMRGFVKEFFPHLKEDSIDFETIVQDMLNFDGYGNTDKNVVAQLIAQKYKINIDGKTYRKWWLDHMLEYVCVFDDTFETLEYLKKKYKLAILTNGQEYVQRGKVRMSGVEPYMDYVVASGEIGIHKPDIRAFHHVCDKLNIKPEEAVFVGDIFSTDIIGAYKAGMKPIWIWTDPNRDTNFPITRIHSLKELKDIL